MGRSELTSGADGVRTVVLVGRTGNGKSATGNSILGKKAFISRGSSSGVTSTCKLKKTVLKDGQVINVIDTPGLFDFSAESDFVAKEIVKCVGLAQNGIHAVLVVFSVRNRFTKEEGDALRSLQTLFGNKIVNYMIVVFTGGDDLDDDETLEDYLGRDECPEPMKEILHLCGNRRILFDNRTKDERRKSEQVQQLLSLVNIVIAQNGGQPYTNEIFVELKVESKLGERTTGLQQQLVEEKVARLRAENTAQEIQMKSNGEICKLQQNLEREQKKVSDLQKKSGEGVCNIL